MNNSIQDEFTTASTLVREAKKLRIPLKVLGYKDSIGSGLSELPYGLTIINLQDAPLSMDDPTGTHWTAIWRENPYPFRSPIQYYYFDSFGFPPPLDIEKFTKGRNGPSGYMYNSRQIQDEKKGFCGSYVIEFGQYMHENKHIPPDIRFSNFLSLFDQDWRKNEYILRDLEKY